MRSTRSTSHEASLVGRRYHRCLVGALALSFLCLGGRADAQSPAADPLAAKLADAFRIDATDVEVTYDFHPCAGRVDASATLRFEMRPGKSRPVFDFNPLRRSTVSERLMLRSLELDGEQLDPYDDADLRRIRTVPAAEPAFEIQRQVGPGEHTLEVDWAMPKPNPPQARSWFFANFDDTQGPEDETETLWPTVSSPEDLIHHTIHLRVHSQRPYSVVGSGRVRRRLQDAHVQTWDIDTERPVPSHTVFFAAVPSNRFRTDRFATNGVDVKVVSDRKPATLRRARSIIREGIGELIKDFGPFPMPRLQVLLTSWSGGMEYYGATRTGLKSLKHELGHMYFGVTALNRTWRDTWFDESAVVWWQAHSKLAPVGAGFQSDLGADRPAAAPGFSLAAYGPGASVLETIARSLGGDREMMRFLADLHARREFEPFTTEDFIDDVLATKSTLDRDQLERWLLSSPG